MKAWAEGSARSRRQALSENIGARRLWERLRSDGDFILVNVLSESSYRARRIPGSVNIPTDQIEARAPRELPDKEREIIAYCASPT
jgi:rhodanese-related sulfurtransferase